jgi:sigma-B regulation protein RsbU (phosphoserine phosphatase)
MLSPALHGSDAKYRLLLDISQEISRTFDLQEVVNHLLATVRSVVEYDAAGVFVLHRNVPTGPPWGTPIAPAMGGNVIAAMASVGFEHRTAENDPMLRTGAGIVGHVINSGERVIASDVSVDPHYVQGRPETRSELAVPIVSNGSVIGALNLESDHLAAFSEDDADLLEALAVAAAICIEKSVLHRHMIQKELIEAQLKIAKDVQSSLLPAAPPVVAGYDVAGLNVPTWDIGGDYFDYLSLPDGRLGLVIADVSGKGVPAALLMATFRATLRASASRNRAIPVIVDELHRTLVESMDVSRYVTAVYGVLDPRTGRFTYLNCGHNPPILLRASGRWERLRTSRRAIGMLANDPVPVSVTTVARGDTLLMYTDGVVDAANDEHCEFGERRLVSTLLASSAESAAAILDALVYETRAHTGRDHYDDDFTLVVVKRH